MEIKAKVIGSLQDNYIDVLVGYDLGQLNGGIVQRIDIEYFPLNCRIPNTFIIITYQDIKDLNIVKIELDLQSEIHKIQ